MLVKPTAAELHIAHLAEAFKILKEHNMKLNPAKCAFGVSAKKILGFYSQQSRNRGQPRQDKSCARHAAAIKHKRSPMPNWKNVALSRFVSRASDKCQPFFQVLKKAFQWDAHYEEAFTTLKTYLSSPPILVSPFKGELLPGRFKFLHQRLLGQRQR